MNLPANKIEMGETVMRTRVEAFVLIAALFLPLLAKAQGVDTAPIDQALGRSGQKSRLSANRSACFRPRTRRKARAGTRYLGGFPGNGRQRHGHG